MNIRRIYITFAVMSASMMQVLDTTIVNVALPHMAGGLSATQDSISWVLTSYIVASCIFMPLTGYLSDKLGRRRYLLISIFGFVLSSALCGLSTSLAEIVLFRMVQGIFGASLVPLSQAIMLDTYPKAERGKAMAIWGMGVMAAPILGPTFGGYLTQTIDWRWTFYINIPVGIVSFLLASRYIADTPKKQRSMDWIGLAALSVAIASLQYVLDRGNRLDWFDSLTVRVLALLCIASLTLFIVNSIVRKTHTLFDLRVFKDRNFVLTSLLSAATALSLYGGMLLLPLLFENMLGYPAMDAGLAMMPRGIASMLSMVLVGKLSGHVSAKKLILSGMGVSFLGYYLMTNVTLTVGAGSVMLPMLLQGMGVGLIFSPLTSIAFSTLPAELATEGAGIFSLIRSLGSAFGISLLTTYFAHGTEANWQHLRGFVQPFNPALSRYLQPLHLPPDGANSIGLSILSHQVALQSQLVSLVSSFWLITASFIFMLPCLMLIRAPVQESNTIRREQLQVEV